MSDRNQRSFGLSIVLNLLTLILLLLSPFLASGDWGWGLGWLYTGSMLAYALVSRAIAIRLHPGFARERATASAMQDTKSWDRWIVPLIALWLPILAVVIAGPSEGRRKKEDDCRGSHSNCGGPSNRDR